MNATAAISATAGRPIAAGDVELWVEQRGAGPDVLLLAGWRDPAEAWSLQLDGLARPPPAHRVRQPRRRPVTAAARSVRGARHGRRSRSCAGGDARCSHDIHNAGPM